MDKKRAQFIASCELSELRTYTLGGYKQKVLLEGISKQNPIMILLHGGPGSPIPFSEGCRGLFPEICSKYIIVYWDQLGCGINNCVIDDSFTINHFVQMTIDLVKELKQEFPNNKVILFGTSWGSVLAAKTANSVPNLIDSVLVYGQVLKELTFNDEVYEALSGVDIPKKVHDAVNNIKGVKQHNKKEMYDFVKYIRKYTEGYQSKSAVKLPMGGFIKGILTSPDYKFKDFIAIVKNGYSKNLSLLMELIQLDISKELSEMQVPYRILQGSKDIVTSTKAVSGFVYDSNNENLSIRIIENNGHNPDGNAMEIIIEEILGINNITN